jgi:hypothetical protein
MVITSAIVLKRRPSVEVVPSRIYTPPKSVLFSRLAAEIR